MSAVDTRNIKRDSLFLMADLRLDGEASPHRVKVRNLSAGGMMAEGGPDVERGARLTVDLKNIGPVEGLVAWVETNRFGIAFTQEIDPKMARANFDKQASDAPGYTRNYIAQDDHASVDARKLRNI